MNDSSKLGKKFNNDTLQKLTALGALLLMCIVFSTTSQYFFQIDNIMTIALQTAITAITAYGMTFVIISAAVDLSIGSTIALIGVFNAMLIKAGVPIWIAIVICLFAGSFVGSVNGFLVSHMKLPPFIATLGSQMAIRGLALVVTNSKPVYIDNAPQFKLLAQTKIFGTIPLPVVYMLLLGIISAFILRKTVIGRNLFAVGSNEEAARLSGINTKKIRIFAYLFSGLMAAFAGILLTSRVNSGQPSIGVGYEGGAIAAAVIKSKVSPPKKFDNLLFVNSFITFLLLPICIITAIKTGAVIPYKIAV